MMMCKKLMFAFAVAAALSGCKSISVENRGTRAVRDADGKVLLDKSGAPVLEDRGWEVEYFQHWNWQRFDSMEAVAGSAQFRLNNYASGADSNLVALVDTSLKGAALLAAKVGAAIASGGGSVAGDAAQSALQAMFKKFLGSGGDAEKATVSCKDGNCTITDGTVSETCADCYVVP